jgi:hypothetical protein
MPRNDLRYERLLLSGQPKIAEDLPDGLGDEGPLGLGETDAAFFDAGSDGFGADFDEVGSLLLVQLEPDVGCGFLCGPSVFAAGLLAGDAPDERVFAVGGLDEGGAFDLLDALT